MIARASGCFLRKLSIRNYKSIELCQTMFKPLTVVVGRNGSGKSNFLDAIHFVGDALVNPLDQALKNRGGLADVRRRSTGRPSNLSIKLEIALRDNTFATYGFEIAAREKGGFVVKSETLEIWNRFKRTVARYKRDSRSVTAESDGRAMDVLPPVVPDRLYLVTASGLPVFRSAYDALLAMGFYNLNPDAMKELQSADAGEILHGDGSNIASVIARLTAEQPTVIERIKAYLSHIVPGIEGVNRVSLGPRETIEFRQKVHRGRHHFYASSMSDGTLRALGALVAVTQFAGAESPIRLVGIEEPETALHPAAAGALMEALREATQHTQVVVTTHSPDLLDHLDLSRDGLLVVALDDGNTRVAVPDEASMEAIRRHLYTPGDMLRMDQLQPDPEDVIRQEQIDLFDEPLVPA